MVALRIGIGLHFYSEGIKKVQNPAPYSAAFFGNAKGRFAPFFHSLIWDADGLGRFDGKATTQTWAEYRDRAISSYGLNENQQKRAKRAYEHRKGQLDTWLADNAEDIREYQLSLERRDRDRQNPDRTEVASLKGQLDTLEYELASKRRELTGPIDQMWMGYKADLHQIAGSPPRGPLSVSRPGRRWLDSESIDFVIRYFDVAIGCLLIFGLFTRTASLLAAAFLGSVIASQWPGTPGAIPVWSQLVEMLGLLVLGATGSGRFAGLDFIMGSLCRWCCPSFCRGTDS